MSHLLIQSGAEHIPLPDQSVDLIFTSPPYVFCRTYGISAQREAAEWVDWMLKVVTECCRVCRGLVLINCAGATRDRVYQPAPEGLCWEWYRRGGNLWSPAYWHRVGIPGSGGKHWLRKDIEYVLCFKRDSEWPAWSDNTACGHPPKWALGGEMSYRNSAGERRNQWGGTDNETAMSGRRANGNHKTSGRESHRKIITKPTPEGMHNQDQYYVEPVLANPGNLIEPEDESPLAELERILAGTTPADHILERVRAWLGTPNLARIIVGGGVMGHPLATENEAPFPMKLPEFFIKSFCPPGGIVLDPFSGSGTTVDAALKLGRRAIGCDLRMSQCLLARRRIAEPVQPKPDKSARPDCAGQEMLFGAAT